MRPQVDSLIEQLGERATVCRINLNSERQLVAKLKVTVCPTYVAFVNGKELFRMAYPTSGDLLLARFLESIRDE